MDFPRTPLLSYLLFWGTWASFQCSPDSQARTVFKCTDGTQSEEACPEVASALLQLHSDRERLPTAKKEAPGTIAGTASSWINTLAETMQDPKSKKTSNGKQDDKASSNQDNGKDEQAEHEYYEVGDIAKAAVRDTLKKQKQYADQVVVAEKLWTEKSRMEKIAKERKKAAQEAMDELASYAAAADEESAKVAKDKEAAEKAAHKNFAHYKNALQKATKERVEADRVAVEKAEAEHIALQKFAAVEAITENHTIMENEGSEANDGFVKDKKEKPRKYQKGHEGHEGQEGHEVHEANEGHEGQGPESL